MISKQYSDIYLVTSYFHNLLVGFLIAKHSSLTINGRSNKDVSGYQTYFFQFTASIRAHSLRIKEQIAAVRGMQSQHFQLPVLRPIQVILIVKYGTTLHLLRSFNRLHWCTGALFYDWRFRTHHITSLLTILKNGLLDFWLFPVRSEFNSEFRLLYLRILTCFHTFFPQNHHLFLIERETRTGRFWDSIGNPFSI